MNTSQDIKMQMVDDNVGIRGLVLFQKMQINKVMEMLKQHRLRVKVMVSTIAQEEEVGIQSTQQEFKFMAAADAYEETERVKVNCTSEDTLQQASTSRTQSDNAPVYDSDGSTEKSILEKPPSYKPNLYSVTPFPKSTVLPKVDKMNALSKPVTSNSAPSTRESIVIQTVNVIAPIIFRTHPLNTSTVDNVVTNKPVKTSVKIKPITVSQPNVIHRQQANSDSNGFSSTKVNNTAKTRRPHPRSNSNTYRVPSISKSSCLSNNLEKIEENHWNLQSSSNQKHMSSECNNNTLAIRNAKFKIVCVLCKQCLGKYQEIEELGSKGSLASSRPRKPRTCLRWILTGRIFAMCGKLTASSKTENKSKKYVCDNASTSIPLEPSSKGFSNSASLLGRISRLRKQHTSIQNRRDLSRNTPLDRVEVLGVELVLEAEELLLPLAGAEEG
nr:hypothetical protein [Tanacetum cinerariifolium]